MIDDYIREVLFIETDYSLKSSRMLWVMCYLIGFYYKPQKILMDNRPEFVGKLPGQWSKADGIESKYIEPGMQMQNAYIEQLNKTYRESILDAYLFDDLEELREVILAWLGDYNTARPHDALSGIQPRCYQQQNDKGRWYGPFRSGYVSATQLASTEQQT